MDEKYKLYHGDCLEVMKNIPDKSIDLVLIDPPYNIGKDKWDKWKTVNDYVEFMGKVFLEIQRVLKNNGSFYIQQQSIRQLVIYSKSSSQGLYPDVSATILDAGNGTKKIPTITSYPSFVFIIGV